MRGMRPLLRGDIHSRRSADLRDLQAVYCAVVTYSKNPWPRKYLADNLHGTLQVTRPGGS